MPEREITGYQIVDVHTGNLVGKMYGAAKTQARRARTRADKLDLEYGAHRYTAKPIWKELGKAGRVSGAVLGRLAAGVGAGVAGYKVGKIIGKQPLITDPKTTYKKFYTDVFTKALRKRKK